MSRAFRSNALLRLLLSVCVSKMCCCCCRRTATADRSGDDANLVVNTATGTEKLSTSQFRDDPKGWCRVVLTNSTNAAYSFCLYAEPASQPAPPAVTTLPCIWEQTSVPANSFGLLGVNTAAWQLSEVRQTALGGTTVWIAESVTDINVASGSRTYTLSKVSAPLTHRTNTAAAALSGGVCSIAELHM